MSTRVAAVLLLALPALAQDLEPVATAVGDGRLLCFAIADDSSGSRVERWHVAELQGSGPAREFLRARGNVAIPARLDGTHLLLASHAQPRGLLVADLAAGSLRELAPGAPHGFVAVHGDDVLFLGPQKQQQRLFAAPWRQAGEPRQLCEQALLRVEQVAGNLVLAVADGERAAWLISIVQGKGRQLFAIDDGADLRLSLSPSGGLVAAGWRAADGNGALAVVDAATGAVRQQWRDLPIGLSPESSATPTVEVGWADDDTVVCSETRGEPRRLQGRFAFVRRSVASGKVVGEQVYAESLLQHRRPPAPDAPPPPAPLFVVERDRQRAQLLRAGSVAPLCVLPAATLQYEDLVTSPNGRFATARMRDGNRHWLQLFADGAEPRKLAEGWAHDLTWLPAAR